MFNQKGQAFSVFELMIAAIVAVAILFVLLPILIDPPVDDVNTVKNAISNSLSSVKNGGSVTSQEFTLSKDILLDSKMFSDKGFDQHSILFDVDKSISQTFNFGIKGTGDGAYSSFMYNGSVGLKANARIICQQTGTSLEETLEGQGISLNSGETPTQLCGLEGEYIPCCVVIINRAN